MKKLLNKTWIIALACLLAISTTIKSSHAFGPFPPMPFDIVLDVPANAGKVVSILQETKRYADSIKRYKKALSIQAVVGKVKLFALEQVDKLGLDAGILNGDFSSITGGEGKDKIEATGVVLAKNNKLDIKEGETDEEKLRDAFYQLFLIYPVESEEIVDSEKQKVKLEALKTIHKKNRVTYRQDIAMNTYLYAQKKELFLDVIERTIDRLDACQKAMGADSGFSEPEEGCTFFGMAMVEVPSQEEAPAPEGGDASEGGEEGGEEAPAGQSEEMQNAYVVSMVYDRLLRFIEELTAVEAEFRASQQLEGVTPAEQSDASDYINNSFKFAYSEYTVSSHAKISVSDILPEAGTSLIQKIKDKAKSVKGSYTPPKEEEKIPDLGKLQALENILNSAIQVHNLKSQLPDFKMQYRQYLMAKKIHERAFNTLKDNETCIVEFIGEHNGNKSLANSQWRGDGVNPFKSIKEGVDHDTRIDGSISKTLLEEYQRAADKKILGTTDEGPCKNYYIEGSVCPSGYSLDVSDTSACKDEAGTLIVDASGKKLYPCVVKTITPDVPEDSVGGDFAEQGATAGTTLEDDEETNAENFAKAGISDPNAEGSFNESEFMSDSDQSEQLENDTRKKNELSWRIGANKMLELTQRGKLSFKPWKDQEYLQGEYLRNKYRNLRLIVKSMDQGQLSYMISKEDNASIKSMEFDPTLLSDLSEVSTYVSLSEVEARSKEAHCNKSNFYCNGTGTYAYKATINEADGSVKIQGYRYRTEYQRDSENNIIYDENGNAKTYKVKELATKGPFYSQVKGQQTYKNEAKSTDDLVAMFTDLPGKLKDKYLAEELAKGNINDNVNVLANKFYKTAKDKGRGVAKDLLQDVLNTRESANAELKVFLDSYYGPNGSITKQEQKINTQKTNLDRFVLAQDQAQQDKNKAMDEEKRTKERLVDIDNQITIKQEQKAKLEKERDDPKANKVVKKLKENAIKGVDKIIANLEAEKTFLSTSEALCSKEKDENCPTEEYMPQKVIEVNKTKATSDLEEAKAKTSEIKSSIAENQDKLEEMIEDFSVEYLEKAEIAQNKIVYSNEEYENFVEPADANEDVNRMIDTKNKECVNWFIGKWTGICMEYTATPYEKDNLEETIVRFYDDNNSLEHHVKTFVEANIQSSDIEKALKTLNISDKFYLASDLSGIGLTMGLQSGVVSTVAEKIKDKVVEHTVEQIVTLLKEGDANVQEEMTRALGLIEKAMADIGINPTTGEIDNPSKIMDAKNYGYTVDDDGNREKNEITVIHENLFEELKKSDFPVDVLDIYGIPELSEEEEAQHTQGSHPLVDDEYFVGLPARGIIDGDIDSGRDYSAPKGPMLNLPPLREIFYYSPLDYDDVPKEGNGKKRAKKERFSPSISHLLNYKYDTFATKENWEYIPEVWRYMLAIPSLREDGKFQQTFIERSMDNTKLNNHIREDDDTSKNNNKYAHIIARAGVYPCKIGNKIIDVKATMDINEKKNGDVLKGYDIKYTYSTVGKDSPYPQCKEVQLSGSNKIKHLLADEDKNVANLSAVSTATKRYDAVSELGQFIDVNKQYRWFLQEVYKFLTDTTKKKKKKDATPPNQINNVWRQLHDLSAYKRNMFGSFLDAVSAEKDAKTNLENAEYQLKEVLKQLCEQVHDLNVTVGDTANEFTKIDETCRKCEADENAENCENYDEICSEEAIATQKTEICVNYIFAKGLADNVNDKAYGTEEYNDDYSGVKNNNKMYNELYFMLDEAKDKLFTEEQPFPPVNPDEPEKENKRKYADVMKEIESDFKVGGKWDSRLEDRMLAIETMYSSLTTDKNEIAYITPDDKVDETAVAKAKTNKIQSFKTGEEGLKGMDNQSKIVPYCPSY